MDHTRDNFRSEMHWNRSYIVRTDRYIKEKFFTSMSEPVMALHYKADAYSNLELHISLDSQIRHACSAFGTNGLVLEGQAPIYVAPPYYSCEHPIVYEGEKEHSL